MNTIPYFRKFAAALFLLAAFFTASPTAFSQDRIDKMAVGTFTSSFSSISGQPGIVALGMQGCISCVASVPIPFAFNFDNTSIPSGSIIYINSTGSLYFKNVSSSYYSRIKPYFSGNPASYPMSVCPMSGLQYPRSGVGGVYYLTTGSAPNRVFTVEWNNMQDYWNSGKYTSYQAKLYESSYQIEFCYQDWGYSIGGEQSSYYHNVGLNGNSTPSFIQVVITGGTTNFSTPSANYRFSFPPPVQLQITPKTLVYGPVLGGNTVTLCVTATHVGSGGTLTFNSATITGSSDFKIVSSPAGPLSPGQSDQYCVQFAPSGSGDRVGILTIVTNGKDSGVQSVALNGSGLYPQIAVDSVIRFKKTRTRMGDSLTQWIHISSIGQAPLFLSSTPISGADADQYFISHMPVNPIPVGVTDSLGITYVPTREGKYVASMALNNNSANNPSIPISLQGTGILPHIVVTPSLVLFDSTKEGQQACSNLSIWNPGSDTLRLSKNYLSSNDGDFTYTGLSGADLNIPPDQTKTVGVCFTPLQQGTRQARLLLKTNIISTFETPRQDTAGIVTIDIRGTGVPFGILNTSLSGTSFTDSALVGVKVCHTAMIKNDGDADITVSGIALGGTDAADFSYSGLPAFPFLLKARTSISFTICGTPDKQGILSAAATVSGKTGVTPVTSVLALSVYGIKACIGALPDQLFETTILPNNGTDSTLCVTVSNCGDLDAIYQVTISGASKADYAVTPAVSAMVPAKTGTTTFCVKYKPSVVGASPASLDITAEDHSASLSIPLKGADGCAVVTPQVDAIGTVDAFVTKNFNVTVTNTGSFDWNPGTPAVTPATEFTLAGTPTVTGQIPNQVITVPLSFMAKTVGTFAAKLTFPNAGPCENTALSVDLNAATVVGSVREATADGFTLGRSYPNPTQSAASFTFTTPKETEVKVTLADLTGNVIRTLITGRVSEGEHTVNFDAAGLASGTYIYMLEAGSTRLVKQLILTK